MKFCYRGVFYQHNSDPVGTVEGELLGKYRGLPGKSVHVNMSRGLMVKPNYELHYQSVFSNSINAN